MLISTLFTAAMANGIFNTTAVDPQIMKFSITETVQFRNRSPDLLPGVNRWSALTPWPFAGTGAQHFPGVSVSLNPLATHDQKRGLNARSGGVLEKPLGALDDCRHSFHYSYPLC